MTQSPGEEFRDLLNKWDAVLLSEQSQLDTILNGNNFVLYFKKDGAIYGTPEEGRVTFARMKQPLDDTPKGWAKEASFTAINISDALEGKESETVIAYDDLDKLKVIGEDEVRRKLKDKGDKDAKVDLSRNDDPNIPPNMTKVDEK